MACATAHITTMSKLRYNKLPDFSMHSKYLFSSPPGRHALLAVDGKLSVKKFAGAHAALDWAEAQGVVFVYMPADRSQRN